MSFSPMPRLSSIDCMAIAMPRPWAALEGPDTRELVRHLVALAGVVVPVELAGLLALGELVRAVAERLVLRQAAFAQPDFFSVDDVARRFRGGAFYKAGHIDSLFDYQHPFHHGV